MVRIEIDGEGTGTGANQAVPSPAGPPRQTVKLLCRTEPAALPGSAADDIPPMSSAIPLGVAVQAVVMRLANSRLRIRVAAPATEEGNRGDL